VEHLYVKFGDPSCIGFLRYRAEKETQRLTEAKTYPATTVDVGKEVDKVVNNYFFTE